MPLRLPILLLLCWLALLPSSRAAEGAGPVTDAPAFPLPAAEYHDEAVHGVLAKLSHRVKVDPFNLVASLIFLAAIVHTFLTARFTALGHHYQHLLREMEKKECAGSEHDGHDAACDRLQFRAQIFHFLGEVEAVFGIWLVPLFIAIVSIKSWSTMVHYVAGTGFAEPIFVGVIMAISASRPILNLAEGSLRRIAALGGGTPAAWWVAILTIGPVLGSFITEPAAMTICALLLGTRFFKCRPSEPLKYATLGLLFVNISVGGTLTHFAAPPVVMVAGKWEWNTLFMLTSFGWKACAGILTANLLYFLKFSTELRGLALPRESEKRGHRDVPAWITVVHLGFIAWTVLTAHYPALVVLGFLFFIAFTEATGRHQSQLSIRSPLLVGFFLAALVIHGGGQQWWIGPVLGSLTEWPLAVGATILTAFNDNAAITYLASLVPGFSPELKYAVVAGAVAGGGLTVIANAPNPAGQSILSRYFEDGVSPGRLFLGAILPTIIMVAAFMLLP